MPQGDLSYLLWVLGGLPEIMYKTHLAKCLTHSKNSVSVSCRHRASRRNETCRRERINDEAQSSATALDGLESDTETLTVGPFLLLHVLCGVWSENVRDRSWDFMRSRNRQHDLAWDPHATKWLFNKCLYVGWHLV